MKTMIMMLQIEKAGGVCQRIAVMVTLLMLCLTSSAMGMGMDFGGGGGTTPPPDNMANVVRLDPISEHINSPTDVALDFKGQIYIADSYANRVVIFSPSRKLIGSINDLAKPISVAVDRIGRIYVGNNDSGNVEVFDANLNFLFKLGKGDGEFSQPNDIDVDLAGNVYVVDKWNHIVRIYSAINGVQIATLGGEGTGAGEFYRPLSIVCDTAARELLVLDSAGGARIQFFSMTWNYIRSLALDGELIDGERIGQSLWPQRITVDSRSRIYVADSQLNMILVYEKNGDYLGFVNDLETDPFIVPMGLAVGAANKLYIASHTTGSVEVYGLFEDGIYGFIGMDIDPAHLSFEVEAGGANPAKQAVIVKNVGNMNLQWQAVTDQSWILLSGLSHSNGIIPVGKENRLNVTVDTTDLEPGVYNGSIIFVENTGIEEVVEVTLAISAIPLLSVAPVSLSFVSEVGTTPLPQYFTVSNDGTANLSWKAVANQPWISMSPGLGIVAHSTSDVDKVSVLADVTGLSAGTYTAAISVTGLRAKNSPATIEVIMTLVDPPDVGGSDPIPEDRVFGDMKWTLVDKLPSVALNSVWTSSDSQVFAVGDEGMILHFDGTDWGMMESPTALDLFGVWGVVDQDKETTDIFAVGQEGIILHYDGTAWKTIMLFGTDLTGIWGTSATDIYAVGLNGIILQYNGTNWSTMGTPTSNDLYGIWGIFDTGTKSIDIFAVGERGTVLSSDGSGWRIIKTSTKADLYGVWGSSPFEVYAVGEEGTIIKRDAHRWSTVNSETSRDLNGIWGSSSTDIYAVGAAGSILHYDGAGWSGMDVSTSKDLNAVWGSFDIGVLAAGQDMIMLHYDGGDWQPLVSALNGLNSVWGRSATDVYAVGMLGSILHYNGTSWTVMESPTDKTLNSVWGSYLTDKFAVGVKGTILRYNGINWSTMVAPTKKTLYDVLGFSQTNIYAVGQRGTLLHYDGISWSTVKSKVKGDLYSLSGRSVSDVYMVGQGGSILHYNGYATNSMNSPTQNDLYSVRVCDSHIFAVGQAGTFLEYDGISWAFLDAGITSNLYDVWCSSDRDVVIVGQDDTFLYYDGNTIEAIDFNTGSSLRGVWGSTETTDIFAVGSGGAIIHGMNE